MPKINLRFVLRSICALAVLGIAAPGAGAQNRASLPERELRASSAPKLYEAIAQLRPDWLLLGAGPEGSSEDRVVVFLNGSHMGNLTVLRGIETAQVLSVRVRSPEFVRRTRTRFPREEFAAALFVETRSLAPERQRGRVTFALEGGFNFRSLAQATRQALREQGYTKEFGSVSSGVVQYAQDGTLTPPVLGASVHYRARGGWGGALAVHRMLESRAGGANPELYLAAVSANVTSTEAALMLTRDVKALRLGAGPALRMVNWTWIDGYCKCDDRETSSSSALGAAAEVRAALPLRSLPISPEFKLLARYYPSQQTEFSRLDDPLEVGGLVVTMGMGISTGF
jgi:hypothetical protein